MILNSENKLFLEVEYRTSIPTHLKWEDAQVLLHGKYSEPLKFLAHQALLCWEINTIFRVG